MDTNLEKRISIALCTYNGERFLKEQLDSIAAQTIPPFELVVCDDMSSDSTIDILESFAATASFPVKLYLNTTNLGFVKNFEKSISLCNGDIIFLSDQDDRWRKDKLEKMLVPFSNPKVGMVFSNALIVNKNGETTGRFLWEAAYFNPEMQKDFRAGDAYKTLYLKTIVSGCTMAFRRKLWPQIQPLPTEILFIHDAWIALMTSLLANVCIIDEPLIDYRLHSGQSVAFERRKISAQENVLKARTGLKNDHYQKHLKQLMIVRERIQELNEHITTEKANFLLRCMEEHEKHLSFRVNIPQNKIVRCLCVAKEVYTGRYHHFSNGLRSAVADMLR